MEATKEQLKTALQKIITAYEALQASDGAKVDFGAGSTAGHWVGRRMESHILKARALVNYPLRRS